MSLTMDDLRRREALLAGCVREILRLVDLAADPKSESVVDFEGVERRHWASILRKARVLVGP